MDVDVSTLFRIIGELTVKITLYEDQLAALNAGLVELEKEVILDG